MANESADPASPAVKRRLIAIVGFMSLAILIVGVYGLYGVWASNKTLEKGLKAAERCLDAVNAARMAQVGFRRQVHEWKSTLLHASDLKGRERSWAAARQAEREVTASLEQLKAMLAPLKAGAEDVEEALRLHKQLGERYRAAWARLKAGGPGAARTVNRETRGADRIPSDEIDTVVARTRKDTRVRLAEIAEDSKAKAETDRRLCGVMQILMAAGILSGLILAVSIIRKPGRTT